MGHKHEISSQGSSTVKPVSLNLKTRPFATPEVQEVETTPKQDESTSGSLKSSENLLEKLINTPRPESAQPIQRKSENRLKTISSQKMSIQTKLNIGEPDDRYEKEADETAVTVVEKINAPSKPTELPKTSVTNSLTTAPVSSTVNSSVSTQNQSVQREESVEEEKLEEKQESSEGLITNPEPPPIQNNNRIAGNLLKRKPQIQRRENVSDGDALSDLDSPIQSVQNKGQDLDAKQKKIGETMGAFSGVKVDTMIQRVSESEGLDTATEILKNNKNLWQDFRITRAVPKNLSSGPISVIESRMTVKLLLEKTPNVNESEPSKVWEHEKIKNMSISDFTVWLEAAMKSSLLDKGAKPSKEQQKAYKGAIAVPQGFYHVTDSENEANGLFTNGAGPCSAVALYAQEVDNPDHEIYAVAHIDANNNIDAILKKMIEAMKAKAGGAIGIIEGVVSSMNASLDKPSSVKDLEAQKARSQEVLANEQQEQGQDAGGGDTYKYVIPLLEKYGVKISAIGSEGEVWMGKGYKTNKQGVSAIPQGNLATLVKSYQSGKEIQEGIESCLTMQEEQGLSGISLTNKEHEFGINKQMAAILAGIVELQNKEIDLGTLKGFIKGKSNEIAKTENGKKIVEWATNQ